MCLFVWLSVCLTTLCTTELFQFQTKILHLWKHRYFKPKSTLFAFSGIQFNSTYLKTKEKSLIKNGSTDFFLDFHAIIWNQILLCTFSDLKLMWDSKLFWPWLPKVWVANTFLCSVQSNIWATIYLVGLLRVRLWPFNTFYH